MKNFLEYVVGILIFSLVLFMFAFFAYKGMMRKKVVDVAIEGMGNISIKDQITGLTNQTVEFYYFKKNDIQCVVSTAIYNGRIADTKVSCLK